jgi:hypothetical protein
MLRCLRASHQFCQQYLYHPPNMHEDRPIVLRIGEAIKYNHAFYDNEFCARFRVIENDCPDRASFIDALKGKK